MTKRTRIYRKLVLAAMLGFLAGPAKSQQPFAGIYHGGLVYAMPILRSVPPLDSSQPTNIQTMYLWLDDAFRQVKPGFVMDQYIQSLPYGDTLKFLGSVLYQIVDDNPVTFVRWGGAKPYPYPYKAPPGRIRTRLQAQFSKLAGDTNRTTFLLDADIVADVKVTDTAQYEWPDDHITPRSVVVTSQILDALKAKYIPMCPPINGSRLKGPIALSVSYPVDTVPATSGTCLRFEYRPNWFRGIQTDEVWQGMPELTDSNGDWIKTDSEYIIFLNFKGISSDSMNLYYALSPDWGWFGSMDGLYPVRNGIVYDPNDDFGIGASPGLTVADWKARLRAKINSIINP